LNAKAEATSSALLEALRQLRLKLLDLTGRNRLLNFRHSPGRSLQSVEGDLQALYERLVESNTRVRVTIRGVPEPSKSDWIVRDGRRVRPDVLEWAALERISTSYDRAKGPDAQATFRALLYPDDLAKHCRKIEREAKLAIEETGANMLFLVLGFFEYPDQRDSDRFLLAPLISIPVALIGTKEEGEQRYHIEFTGDDVAINLSLQEKLRVDHSLILPEFDEDAADIDGYFAAVENVIRNRPGFSIRRRVTLCLLSFTNMLLVRDLDPENWPETSSGNGLLDHEVVRRLFEAGGETEPPIDATEEPIDNELGDAIPLVFDADSSQHRALIEVLQKQRHLVIEGPPGTGKSQTITNLIAACLAQGKTVLFVAEKLAALEVVKTRLSAAGMDPFVLELHSSKTSKKRVLEELERRLEYTASAPSSLPQKLEQWSGYRRQLRTYVTLLGSIVQNRMGLTVHQLMWRAESYRLKVTVDDPIRMPPEVPEAPSLTPEGFSRRWDALQHLADQYVVIGRFDENSPFWGFYPRRLLPGDDHRLEQLFLDALRRNNELTSDAEHLAVIQGDRSPGLSLEACQEYLGALRAIREAMPVDAPVRLIGKLFAGDSTGKRVRHLVEQLEMRIERYRTLEQALFAIRHEAEVTSEHRDRLSELESRARATGSALGNVADVLQLGERLEATAIALNHALERAESFCERHRLPKLRTRSELSRFRRLAETVVRLPEGQWHHFRASLREPDATEVLRRLEQRQREWWELHQQLHERLYLDPLPRADVLRGGILTFREGSTWYRVFQRQWREAVTLHRRISRDKQRRRAEERLQDLEELDRYARTRERWRSDPAWLSHCGVTPEGEPVSIDGHLEVATWLEALRQAVTDLDLDSEHLPSLTRDEAARYRRDFSEFSGLLSTLQEHLEHIDAALPALQGLPNGESLASAGEEAQSFSELIARARDWLVSRCAQDATVSQITSACAAALERRVIRDELSRTGALRELLADQFRGIETDVAGIIRVIEWGQQVQASRLPAGIRRVLLTREGLEQAPDIAEVLSRVLTGLTKVFGFEQQLQHSGECDIRTWCGISPEKDLAGFSRRLKENLTTAIEHSSALVEWSRYIDRREEASDLGLDAFVTLLEGRKVPAPELTSIYGYASFAAMVRAAFQSESELVGFSGIKQSKIIEEFRRLDKEIIAARGAAIAADCVRRARPPAGYASARVEEKTEMALVNHLIPQQRPRVSVRKLLQRAHASVQVLKPCLMMGPHAVAQFLRPGAMQFDVVVMDEASQLPPQEALGAIARGRQLIVVGDPKQLPPTTFFARQGTPDEEAEEFTTTDTESILDLCLGAFRPSRSLRWHYRSKHHSLIEFSNHRFYDGRLIVCPSPYGQGARLGVRATYLAHAVYENQTNLIEAKRVVDAVAEHIATRPDESLGVVTLNIKQRDLISELLEERLTAAAGAEEYRERWHKARQDLFVKNLENVQGDERDCIIISTTFGKPPGADVVRQNFGPISRAEGWRRLNVLFTRARHSIAVYTSLRPTDIVVDGTTPSGTKALRDYLEFARTGQVRRTEDQTVSEPESDFERAVIEVLRHMSYEVVPQLGAVGFRIDIAVKHPDYPGAYLAAIECDGAAYHSTQSARDRDRIRQEILESQGWKGRIWRIWSTDWFRSPRREAEKLREFLDRLRKSWKPEHGAEESWSEESGPAAAEETSSELERTLEVTDRLVDSEPEWEVRVGDTVEYVDVGMPEEVRRVRITQRTTALDQGMVAATTPLAQSLLEAVVGDEVSLAVPGVPRRILRILAIKRDSPEAQG
jgi:transcription elongation GreA/GreB family factor